MGPAFAVRDNSCAPTTCGRAIDPRAAPSRDEFPKLRISSALARRFELSGDACWTSKKAWPVTVIICGSRISSFWESLKLKGKLCVVQPKTVCRSSHHVEPTGISAPTLPAFLPSASLSTSVMSPSFSTFTLTRRPVRLYHFCSAAILVSVSGVKGTFGAGPFHSQICDGVTD